MTQAYLLPPVENHHISSSHDPSAQALHKIIMENHAKHNIMWDMGMFPINIPDEHRNLAVHTLHTYHHVSSLYMLGAPPEKLHEVYTTDLMKMVEWPKPQLHLTKDNWRQHLGNKAHAAEYIDFFTRELAAHHGDWKKVIQMYLFEGAEPLANGLVGDLTHPLIHLGYAYEMQSKELGMEALVLAAIHYHDLHRYLDDDDEEDDRPTPSLENACAGPMDVIRRIRHDGRLDGAVSEQGRQNIAPLFKDYEAVMLEHWNSWNSATSVVEQLRDAYDFSVALLIGAGKPFDFFILHVLTAIQALRAIVPEVPERWQRKLIRQWWLFAVTVYVIQMRPRIDTDTIDAFELKEGEDWEWVRKMAVESPASLDAHYVKGKVDAKRLECFQVCEADEHVV